MFVIALTVVAVAYAIATGIESRRRGGIITPRSREEAR